VWSSIAVTRMPVETMPLTADSRPAPEPRIRTSTSLMPILRAFWAADSPARVAANGVLLRAPLKPIVPAESQHTVSPFMSVIVTRVLFCVALTWAIPRTTFLRTFLIFFAIETSADHRPPWRPTRDACDDA
jgi:hypothetical protein